MAGLIRIYHAVSLTIDGKPFDDFGSLRSPVAGAPTALTYARNPVHREVLVPAGEKVTLWQWADTKGLAYASIAPVNGEGFVQLGVRYSTATTPAGNADLTPTGVHPSWRELSKSCTGTFDADSERALIDTVSDAVNSTETGGYPSVWASSDATLGVADKIAAFNQGSEDVLLEVLIVPK